MILFSRKVKLNFTTLFKANTCTITFKCQLQGMFQFYFSVMEANFSAPRNKFEGCHEHVIKTNNKSTLKIHHKMLLD